MVCKDSFLPRSPPLLARLLHSSSCALSLTIACASGQPPTTSGQRSKLLLLVLSCITHFCAVPYPLCRAACEGLASHYSHPHLVLSAMGVLQFSVRRAYLIHFDESNPSRLMRLEHRVRVPDSICIRHPLRTSSRYALRFRRVTHCKHLGRRTEKQYGRQYASPLRSLLISRSSFNQRQCSSMAP